jgi:ribonuclease HI
VGQPIRGNENVLRVPGWFKSPRVYVDAKILNMHDPALAREAYVGYVMEGTDRRNARREGATESDDAEVLAILFAIEELKGSFARFTIVCDHESVVSEANRDEAKYPSELMEKLRRELRENPSIKLEALQANPAHGVVTEYVNRAKTDSEMG